MSPRPRYRQEGKVADAVAAILQDCGVADWIRVEVRPRVVESYRQDGRGRPSPQTRYVKQVAARFALTYAIDEARVAEAARSDGVFPLVTNVTEVSALQLLQI